MCGIFGWISRSERCPGVDELRRLTDLLSHRGPDAAGYELMQTSDARYSVGFGHRRLSIIDLSSAGAQPMWSADREICLIFNGEIYNYIELRAELESLGYHFGSASDTEVLIEAVRHWGKDAVGRFRGMFSFAIFDRSRQTVLLARDPFGKKPLFIGESDGDIFFSSEIEPITRAPQFTRVFDWGALDGYLLDRFVPGPGTFFKDVRKLPPGCLATWSDGCLKIERYYVPPLATVVPDLDNFDSAVKQFSKVFDEAVRIRMRSDAPFGAFLSGGIDSSAVVAVMTRHSAVPIRTFSVGFDESTYSEIEHSELVARRFGTDHQSIIITAKLFFENWEEAIRHRGAPVSEASDIPIMLLAREARSSVKMVLTGEGADEFLAGYPKHIAECYANSYQRAVPAVVHDLLFRPIIEQLPYGMHRIKVLGKAFGERDPSNRVRIWFGGLSMEERKQLLGQRALHAPVDPFPFSITTKSNLRRSQFFDQTSWLPDSSLERADRMMMAGSIEGRMPFMDTKLAELTARMPDSFLVRKGRGKMVLRAAMEGILPNSILTRGKNGFRVPIGEWFRGSHRDLVRDLLTSDASKVRGMLDGSLVKDLVDDHIEGRVNNERILWSLSNLEQFLRVYKPDLEMPLAAAA
jgi:asparagine synthase (glutamine-hydrolysing)